MLSVKYNDRIFFNVKTLAYTPGIHAPVLAITRPAISSIIHINEMYRERSTSEKYCWSK